MGETEFKGKVVVVTGGASGIGLACARLLAGEGASVICVDRAAPDPGTDVALALKGDVGDATTVEAQAAEVVRRFNRFDGLVTCAGHSNGRTAPDCPLDEWEAIIRTNVTGTFLWAREAVRAMREREGGAIVMVGSQLAQAGGRSNAAYLASKGAVATLARTMAVDHAAEGVRVNVLVPGAIDTPLLARAFQRADDPDAARRASAARHALGRLGRPEEMARAVRFLLSSDASFTTGASLFAEGGWLAM